MERTEGGKSVVKTRQVWPSTGPYLYMAYPFLSLLECGGNVLSGGGGRGWRVCITIQLRLQQLLIHRGGRADPLSLRARGLQWSQKGLRQTPVGR